MPSFVIACLALVLFDVLALYALLSGSPMLMLPALMAYFLVVPIGSLLVGIQGLLWLADESPWAVEPRPQEALEVKGLADLWARLAGWHRGEPSDWTRLLARVLVGSGAFYLLGTALFLLCLKLPGLRWLAPLAWTFTSRLQTAAGMSLFLLPCLLLWGLRDGKTKELATTASIFFLVGMGCAFFSQPPATSLAEFIMTQIGSVQYPQNLGYPAMLATTVWYLLGRSSQG